MLILGSVFLQNACKSQGQSWPYGQDQDGDGWPSQFDCDDENDAVFPGADEIVGDGIDQDCSGSDAVEPSGEGEGEGGEGSTGDACEGRACGSGGATASGGNSGDGDGDGSGGEPARGVDADGDGYAAEPDGDDCDDDRLEVHPGAVEVPLNGIDENCDGSDLAGDPIFITDRGASPLEPPVVARVNVAGNEQFLVIWSDSRKAPGQDIYGQMVDVDGELIGDEIEIEVTDNLKKTDVFLAAGDGEFLVTWVNADGLWLRQLDEAGAPITDDPVGFGPPGSIAPRAVRTDDHWAVVWKDGVELTGWVRSMRDDRAKWDVYQVGTDAVGSLNVASRPEGFTVGWTDEVDETSYGVWTQKRAIKGNNDGNLPLVTLLGDYSDLQMAFDGVRTWLAFNVANALPFAAITALDPSTQLPIYPTVQLSTEVLSLNSVRLGVSTEAGPYVAWNDARHVTSSPSATSIYGNGVVLRADADPQLTSLWNTARPVLVDTAVEIGGVSRGETTAMVSGLVDGRVFVIPVEL